MKDAFGGIINIIFIALFLVIVEGVLGLVYNYAKAYKMKNSIISIVEQYEASGCFNSSNSTLCKKKIEEAAQMIGYSPTNNLNCPTGFTKTDNSFCWKKFDSTNSDSHFSKNPSYYRIITQVDMTMPIVDKIFGFSVFQVVGDTRIIEIPGE